MKKSNYPFGDGFFSKKAMKNNPVMVFDWDKAAKTIKEYLKNHPDLIAEAGLQEDWDYTGGIIFSNNEPISDTDTYLASNWAVPTLILSWDNKEQEEIECYCIKENSRFDKNSKWDDESLKLLK